MTLGELIGSRRKARGLSRTALAVVVKLHPDSLTNVELGRRQPSAGVLSRLVEALDLDAGQALRLATAEPDPNEVTLMLQRLVDELGLDAAKVLHLVAQTEPEVAAA